MALAANLGGEQAIRAGKLGAPLARYSCMCGVRDRGSTFGPATIVDGRSAVSSVSWRVMTSRRPLVVALVTLCGLAIAAGAALPWVTARGTRPASGITHTSLVGLRHLTYSHSGIPSSFAVAVAAAGVLVVVGALIGSRVFAGAFAAIGLAAAGLWIALNARHYNPTDLRYNDLRVGAWLTIAGGVVALIAVWWMRRPYADAMTGSSVGALTEDQTWAPSTGNW